SPASRIARARGSISRSLSRCASSAGGRVRDRQGAMRTFFLWLFAAVVAAGVSVRTTRQVVAQATLRERNYRGLEIPTAGGIAVLLAFACASAALGVLHLIFSSSEMLADAAGTGILFVGA